MTEPPRAAGGHLADRWPRVWPTKLSLWDFLGGDAAMGPLLRRGERRAAGWGLSSGSVAGLRAHRVRPCSSTFPALQRACALVGYWRLEVP